MRPRYDSDYRTLFWAFVLFPLPPALSYTFPSTAPWLLPFGLYLAYCAGVLTHNHTHVPVFAGQRQNGVYSAWLSIFYGCPIAFWLPTHQLNHHRFVNGTGDVTRTDRRSSKHDLWQALVYSLACAGWQRPLIARYVRRAYARGGHRWADLRNQGALLLLGHAGMLVLGSVLHGPALGTATYALSLGLPALCAPLFMFFTNYIQHVHCDTGSRHNHSRNFVSPLANWFVFDAGYHTVHHERPALHWSHYAALHRERASSIHPSLEEHSVLSFCIKSYAHRARAEASADARCAAEG